MRRASSACLLLVVAACATPRPRAEAPVSVAWPAAPAEPRVKFLATLPPPARQPSRWRRFWQAFVGIDASARTKIGLARPFGVAIAPDGDVVVADPDLRGVFRIRGTDLVAIACPGLEWDTPMAVSAAPYGGLLVADAGAAVVIRVAPDGSCAAIGAGHLERPTGVAVNSDRIYVADPPRHHIAVFSADGGVVYVGSRGDGAAEFDFPSAVALDADGTLLVVDALNFRIVRLTAAGATIASFGSPGEEGSSFTRPKGVAVDREGRIYVSDAQRDVVLVFGRDGSFEYSIGGTGESPGWFTHPAGLAVLDGRLYVADSHNRRIQVFEILGDRS